MKKHKKDIYESFSNIKLRWFFIVITPVILILMNSSFLEQILHPLGEVLSDEVFGVGLYTFVLSFIFIFTRKNITSFCHDLLRKNNSLEFKEILYLSFLMFFLSLGFYLIEFIPLSFIFPNYVKEILEESSFYRLADEKTVSKLYLANTLNVLMTVVYAPLVEELLFRGWLLLRLSLKWGRVTAILIVSLLFAVLHQDILGAFAFSITTCLLYFRTGSLRSSLMLHGLNNLWVIILVSTLILIYGEEPTYSLDEFRDLWPMFLIFFSVSFPLYLLWIKKNKGALKSNIAMSPFSTAQQKDSCNAV